MVTRTEKRASFFHFFNPPEMPDIDEDADEMPEGLEELAEQAQMDLDVGEALKDKVSQRCSAVWRRDGT
jgi:nucleosome assembly protein 1-like 1